MRAPFRTQFDPAGDFQVRKPFTIGERRFLLGEPFDKTQVTTRKLRQLFDHRTVVYLGENPGGIIPIGEEGPALSDAQIEADDAARAVAATRQARNDLLDARAAISIPEDWASLPWFSRKALAGKLSDSQINNADEARAAIEAELARRAGTS